MNSCRQHKTKKKTNNSFSIKFLTAIFKSRKLSVFHQHFDTYTINYYSRDEQKRIYDFGAKLFGTFFLDDHLHILQVLAYGLSSKVF